MVNLWSLLQKTQREGIKKFLMPGLTITNQDACAIRRYVKFIKQKFPDARWTTMEIRERLTKKLNSLKTRPRRSGPPTVDRDEVMMMSIFDILYITCSG